MVEPAFENDRDCKLVVYRNLPIH